jgi:hypothetical protein
MTDRTSQELLITALGAEMDRYWTRFNIFAAVQVGAVVGVVNGIEVLSANPGLFRFVLVFLILFSMTGVVTVIRGHDLQRAVVCALDEVERSLPEEHRLLALTRKHFRMPTFLSNHICSVFAVFCSLCWLAAWVFLEVRGYGWMTLPRQ